jgi:CDP-glucose 4,6-dehydratase
MPAPHPEQLRASYQGRRVLVTGHTGFKGSWLTTWLHALGAEVSGLALPPEPGSLFERAKVQRLCQHAEGDIRKLSRVREVISAVRPEVVFHLAAQPLVRRSYDEPLETLETNVIGTAHVLEAIRLEHQRCAVVVVSSDKCYENNEGPYGYRETDPLGGHDVYSMSKGATELVAASWRRSFFNLSEVGKHGVRIASARAGNVIGGGDVAKDRIVPDAIRALSAGQPISVRNPRSVRPWQHVLEPLGGYLLLSSRMLQGDSTVAEAWNFGPRADSARPVADLVDNLILAWGSGSWVDCHDPSTAHEAFTLRLSIDKAQARLGWVPRWSFEQAVSSTVAWHRAADSGASADALLELCRSQIASFSAPA